MQMCGLDQETVLLVADITERVAGSRSLVILPLPVSVSIQFNGVVCDTALQCRQTGDFFVLFGQLVLCIRRVFFSSATLAVSSAIFSLNSAAFNSLSTARSSRTNDRACEAVEKATGQSIIEISTLKAYSHRIDLLASASNRYGEISPDGGTAHPVADGAACS
jgi:hypothetical protein